jgi:hypothetical protein
VREPCLYFEKLLRTTLQLLAVEYAAKSMPDLGLRRVLLAV